MALEFVAGCIGGCAGVIVGHPLDTVKVNLQTQDGNNPKYKGTIGCLKSLLAKEGIRGVYKGVTSPLLGVAAINAIVFGVHGNTQKRLSNPDSIRSHFIAGAAAGLFQSFICSPVELAKSRMQVADCSNASTLDYIRNIYHSGGLKGVFRGLNSTIAREVPAFGIYFATYEYMVRSDSDAPISTALMLMAGGVAGVASWLAVYPIDVLKNRYQIDGFLSSAKYTGAWDCMIKSIKVEGYGFMFRGLAPTLIRAFPVNAATFAGVTWTMRLLSSEQLSEGVRGTESLLESCVTSLASKDVNPA